LLAGQGGTGDLFAVALAKVDVGVK
jgi:hypothetical protein